MFALVSIDADAYLQSCLLFLLLTILFYNMQMLAVIHVCRKLQDEEVKRSIGSAKIDLEICEYA